MLLTSFRTWLADQRSNSSDDLLELVVDRLPKGTALLRRLPVHAARAARRVAAADARHGPDVIVLCGMAARRRKLNVELRARRGRRELRTAVDVPGLVRGLRFTRVSRDAGRFVCEALYYRTLDLLRRRAMPAGCIFVHVPVLTAGNRGRIVADFLRLLQRLPGKAGIQRRRDR
jgi:pyroglutamyl-peptidase